jgi:ACT domain-containing protein
MNVKKNAQLTDEIVRAVQARLGQRDAGVGALIAQEVALALDGEARGGGGLRTGSAVPLTPGAAGAPGCVTVCGVGSRADEGVLTERIVVTANGRNGRGIVARLTAILSEADGDIRDISQTIVGDYFTMIIVVDLGTATRQGTRFSQLKARLEQAGGELGVHVVALHDDILTSMHTV